MFPRLTSGATPQNGWWVVTARGVLFLPEAPRTRSWTRGLRTHRRAEAHRVLASHPSPCWRGVFYVDEIVCRQPVVFHDGCGPQPPLFGVRHGRVSNGNH